MNLVCVFCVSDKFSDSCTYFLVMNRKQSVENLTFSLLIGFSFSAFICDTTACDYPFHLSCFSLLAVCKRFVILAIFNKDTIILPSFQNVLSGAQYGAVEAGNNDNYFTLIAISLPPTPLPIVTYCA